MTWLNYCRDCDRPVKKAAAWKKLATDQRALYLPAVDGKCSACYQRALRELHKQRRGEQAVRKAARVKTFCGCGCWIFTDENCPACEYKLTNRKKTA